MYINIEQLALSGLKPVDLVNLLAIRQKDEFYLRGIPDEDLEPITGNGYAERIASGRLKLTKKGESLLYAIETPGITAEISKTLSILLGMYGDAGREVGVSEREAESRLVWFMGNTNFRGKAVCEAVEEYLSSPTDKKMSLCNLIWRPPSIAFSVHKNLKDSKLFDLIARRYRLNAEAYFADRKGKELEWEFAVARLPNPPSRGNRDILFTFDHKAEKERLNAIKTHLFNYLRSFRT